jgi:hypothetical protein
MPAVPTFRRSTHRSIPLNAPRRPCRPHSPHNTRWFDVYFFLSFGAGMVCGIFVFAFFLWHIDVFLSPALVLTRHYVMDIFGLVGAYALDT